MDTLEWNPRFTAYATAHNHTEAEMLAYDARKYPGGKMTGFMLWIATNRRKFKTEHSEAFIGDMILDQDAWTAFLFQQSN